MNVTYSIFESTPLFYIFTSFYEGIHMPVIHTEARKVVFDRFLLQFINTKKKVKGKGTFSHIIQLRSDGTYKWVCKVSMRCDVIAFQIQCLKKALNLHWVLKLSKFHSSSCPR